MRLIKSNGRESLDTDDVIERLDDMTRDARTSDETLKLLAAHQRAASIQLALITDTVIEPEGD